MEWSYVNPKKEVGLSWARKKYEKLGEKTYKG